MRSEFQLDLPKSGPVPTALTYRPDIDGLRAIAITAVVAYHAGLPWIRGGFVGVDIFFVISGYLIGYIIYSEMRTHKFSFGRFYVRRAKRILPALLALMLILYAIVTALMVASELTAFAKSALFALGAMSNIWFWRGITYFSPNAELNPLLMTWSLGVEEQFYILFPFVLLLLRKASPKKVFLTLGCLVCSSFGLSLWCATQHPGVAFYLLPPRAWELGLGAMLAIWHAERSTSGRITRVIETRALPFLGIACILISIFGIDSHMSFPSWIALFPTLGAASLIASKNTTLSAVLGSRIPVFIGRISYSWYLWHWPFLSITRLSASQPLSAVATSVVVITSFVVAVLSWWLVEQPFRHSREVPGRLLPKYAFAMLLVAVPAVLLIVVHGWPQRLDKSVVDIDNLVQERQSEPCTADSGVSTLSTDSRCWITGAKPDAVVLLGDSHASALASAIRDLAVKDGWGFHQLTKSSCAPLEGVTSWIPSSPLHASQCATFNRLALQNVLTDSSAKVVVIAGYWSVPIERAKVGFRFAPVDGPTSNISLETSENNLREGLTALVRHLRSAGKSVVLVEDVPILDFDPLRLEVTQEIPARLQLAKLVSTDPEATPWHSSISHVVNAHDVSESIVRDVQRSVEGVELVNPFDGFCAASECAFASQGNLFYLDEQHLSNRGASIALQSLDIPALK
jgi:peptidoglycan/LPS O-acetylase OafA/YrhL